MTLRELRMWHWRQVVANREHAYRQEDIGNVTYIAGYFHRVANFHMKAVQMLNDELFKLHGITSSAEQDCDNATVG